ncbi:MAG TPA: ribonuclease HII [Candidatus Saccharimonadales bacterium]|nr:ribonuclease HII [Candidatus Saccharimonadales bacterium]
MGSVIGIDEVGRGCLAGPLLVVAARDSGELPAGLKDSKLLSRNQREEILNKLSICCEWGEGWVKCSEIDRFGLSKALKLGAARALRDLKADRQEAIILDGKFNYLPKTYKAARTLIKADNLIPIVSAAGIIAKVKRDQYMINLGRRHPGYRFDSHVGYGTKNHMLALENHGALKYIHRHSFLPIAQLSGGAVSKRPSRA